MEGSIFARLGPAFLADPYPYYEMLRGADGVTWIPDAFGVGAFFVTSHAVCSSVLRNKQFGKEGHRVVPPEKLAQLPQESAEVSARRKNNMLFRDPPDHTRLRGLVSQAFTPRTVEHLRPRIADIAERLLDDIEAKGGEVDLVSSYAFPLPIIVIAELLGVSPEDRDRFKAWSSVLTIAINPGVSVAELQQTRRAVDELTAYLTEVIEERRRAPQADLISDMVRANEAGDRLSVDEITGACRLLLTAGHETTVNLVANGTLTLLQHPAAREALAADPSKIPAGVEELLRYDSPVQLTMRFAMEDAPLGPRTAKRGDFVMVLLGGANRDPAQFDDPTRIDVARANAHTHLSFGAGIHYCLGAPLARLEGEIALAALLRRLPRLTLAEGPIAWRAHPVLRGPRALPVRF